MVAVLPAPNYFRYMADFQRLKAEDVDWFWSSQAKGRNTTYELTLTHKPTGKKLSGKIKEGRYTHAEIAEKKRALYQTLFDQLEDLIL